MNNNNISNNNPTTTDSNTVLYICIFLPVRYDWRSPLRTVLLGGLVVLLADQPPVLHQVELVPGGQLPAAHHAGEAVQVVHKVLGLPHHLRRRDPLLARRTLCSETPAGSDDVMGGRERAGETGREGGGRKVREGGETEREAGRERDRERGGSER